MKIDDINYDLYVINSPQNRAILFLSNLFKVIFGLFTLYIILVSDNFNSLTSFKVLLLFFLFLILDKILMSYTLEYILVFKNKIEEFQYNILKPRKSIIGEIKQANTNELEDKPTHSGQNKEIKILCSNGEEITYNVFEI